MSRSCEARGEDADCFGFFGTRNQDSSGKIDSKWGFPSLLLVVKINSKRGGLGWDSRSPKNGS